MSPRPKPLIGALLGLALGLVVSALLWALGITPPDRLPLFGIVALSIALTATLTTLVARYASGRYVTALVIAALCGGVALTGIPEYVGTGHVTPGCQASATSSLEPDSVSPAGTSALDPFDMTTTDTVSWTATTDDELDAATPSLSLMVGGFAIPVWNGQDAYDGMLDLAGEDSVADREQAVRDSAAVTLTGTFHLSGSLESADGTGCEMDAYLRVQPDGTFSGLLLAALWALLAVVVIAIILVSVGVGRSISAARASRPVTDSLTTTGGTSRVEPTSGSLAQVADATTGEPPARREAVGAADAVAGERAPRASRTEDGRTAEGLGRSSGDTGSGASRSSDSSTGRSSDGRTGSDTPTSSTDAAAADAFEEPTGLTSEQTGPTVEEASVEQSVVDEEQPAAVEPSADSDTAAPDATAPDAAEPDAAEPADTDGEPQENGTDASADPTDPSRP